MQSLAAPRNGAGARPNVRNESPLDVHQMPARLRGDDHMLLIQKPKDVGPGIIRGIVLAALIFVVLAGAGAFFYWMLFKPCGPC